MSKVALLGAGGFIGSNLTHRLVNSGNYSVITSDIEDAKLSLRFENEPFNFEYVDITKDDDRIDEVVAEADVVFDLVAHVRPAMFINKPLNVVKLNFFDCLKVVDACVRHNTRLIHFSTSEVYGKTGGSEEPFREDETDLILGPIANQRWIYSCAKQLLDRMIHAHGIENGLNFTLVRPFNFVGPLMDQYIKDWNREDNPRVFANFMSALVFNRPLRLVDGGSNRRVFTYIDDAIDALMLILDHPEQTNRQIINVGNPANELTVRELAEKMADTYVRKYDHSAKPVIENVSSAEFYGSGYEDCDRRMPDISKMEALGWKPKYDADALVETAMDYWVRNQSRLIEKLGA